MDNLISLTCPSCGSALEADSSKITTKCKFCQTEILIRDFVTERRVDKSDRLSSLQALADNAVKNQDYKKAYGFFEEICKLEPTKENLAYLNFYGYAAGKIEYLEPLLSDLYVFDPQQHRNLVARLRTIISKKKYDAIMANSLTPQQANEKYNPIICELDKEFNKLRTKKCHCGATLEYNEDICPKCGSSYSEHRRQVLEENNAKRKAKRAKIIKLSLIIGIPVIIIVSVISIVTNNQRVNKIQTAIQNKEFSVAEELLDDYKHYNSKLPEVYKLYADLYLAENNPQKAVTVLEEGLKKVSSGKENLQEKIDAIKSEYHIE